MRVVALLAVRNEERFVTSCLGRLASHGVDTYLIDTGSTDRTLELAERWLGRGLIGIEELRLPGGRFSLPAILERKEQLAATLDADWLVHLDADEARVPPRSDRTLAVALAEADAAGYNAVNFLEYTFVPTRRSPTTAIRATSRPCGTTTRSRLAIRTSSRPGSARTGPLT